MKTSKAHKQPSEYVKRSELLGTALITGSILLAAFVITAVSADRDKDPSGRKTMDKEYKLTEKEWKKRLTPEQYKVLRKKGTERPFTGKYYKYSEEGVYVCAGCTQELFTSSQKFDSGCGWPSFSNVEDGSVEEHTDNSYGMQRTEILCSRCKGHLGHVFNDGPRPTGLRYCINSAALDFQKKDDMNQQDPVKKENKLETATFGAGCFWCTEAVFGLIDGVKSVQVGYTGGTKENPTYKEVCTGKTGHAEVAQITFDPEKVSYEELLDVFWKAHDPTSLNSQGADRGTQYRSAIFYHSEEQKKAAEESLEKASKKLSKPIATKIVEAGKFYEAEDYHQDYYENNPQAPYCRMVIAPKLKKLKP